MRDRKTLPKTYYLVGALILLLIGGHYLMEERTSPIWILAELAIAALSAMLVYMMHVQQCQHYAELRLAYSKLEKVSQEKSSAYEIFHNIGSGLVVVSRDNVIIFANKVFADQLGLKEEALIGRKCFELCRRRDRSCDVFGDRCPAKTVFETGESCRLMHSHLNVIGDKISSEWNFFPVRDENGRIVSAVGITNDSAENLQLKRQLQHAQKMESVGLLAGGIAHDFNNMLAGVIGYAELLNLELREFGALGREARLIDFEARRSAIKSHAEAIIAAVQKAAKLTHDLMAFSRSLPVDPKPVQVSQIIQEVKGLLERIIGEDISLRIKPHSEGLVVLADKVQIEQVLMNLATNARDAMPKGGVLEIETGAADLDAAAVDDLGFGRPGRYATITFRDTGSGMDEKTMARIFEPFFTTKELGRGTGLGLAMAYGIIKQHHGNIQVRSTLGKGTEFLIHLPVSEEVPHEVQAGADENGRTGQEHILIIEDDQDVRQTAQAMLEASGYHVLVAESGEEGLRVFRNDPGSFDLILTDLVLPGKDGYATYLEIQETDPEVTAIFMSGYGDEVLEIRGVRKEELRFLSKPFSRQALLKAVRQALDS